MNKSRVISFIVPKIKYGASSVIATSIDYSVFFICVTITAHQFIPWIQALSYTCGLLTNFFLQKKFVFDLNRPVTQTFFISVTFSFIGIGLSTLFIYLITKIPFFLEHLILAKVLITGTLFLYNFYTKRYAFERKGLLHSVTKNEDSETKVENEKL